MIRFTPWTTVVHAEDVDPEFPMYVYKLMPFSELPSRVGAQDFFVDVIGQIVGVSQLAYVRMPTNTTDTPKQVTAFRDDRNTEMKIVLWGQRVVEFEAQLVYDNGQNLPVIGVFVGLLMKSYNNDETLSRGSACRWYLNEDIPEIDDSFERLGDDFPKKFNGYQMVLRSLPQNATEVTSHRKLSTSCETWIHGRQRFRLCLEGTDGTGASEFVFFNRVAQQLVGKYVMALLRSSALPREIAAVVSQKYTLAVSVTQKSL